MEQVERESLEADVLIVGGGPAGLAAACRLMQLAGEKKQELMVCLVEKGSEIGAHILSGAIFEPSALDELFPDAASQGAPLDNPVVSEDMYFLPSAKGSIRVPHWLLPKDMTNDGNHALSLGNMARWLGEQAEALGVNIFPGFAASETLVEDGRVVGVITGDMGIDRQGNQKDTFQPGYEIRAKYTLFAEGCRGHLGKKLLADFNLAADAGTQHYGIGLKEIWDVTPENHQAGRVVHSLGWPLGFGSSATGGGFLYHLPDNQVSLGLIVDLSYSNPHLSPFDEFQRWKHHPLVSSVLEGGQRRAYGARAIVKGGLYALPRLGIPGALLIGDDAGFLNPLKIRGSHTAMKSGMLAAETLYEALSAGDEGGSDLSASFTQAFRESWLYDELHRARNFGGEVHKLGSLFGSAAVWVEQYLFGGRLPIKISDPTPDHATLKPANRVRKIRYDKPDGVLSFDKSSSVYLSNTNHEEDQPCHLVLNDAELPIRDNLPMYDEPAQRYCPAGVYEVVEAQAGPQFVINAQNCVHCKTCDIKDPAQNINWVVPEGAGGPNYPNM